MSVGFAHAAPYKHAPITSRIHPKRRTIKAQAYEEDPEYTLPETVPIVSTDADWRAFRARLVAAASASTTSTTSSAPQEWAHELKAPEPGCLLLANPLYFTTNQTYFQQSVILILSHDIHGSVGVIINKPTQHKMSDFKDKTNLGSEFDDCILYLGGDVGDPNALTVIHSVPNKNDSQELISGVYLSNGIEGVQSALASGETTPDKVKILTRYAGWGPGQLVSEVNRGVWMLAAASKDVIISPIPTTNDNNNSDTTTNSGDDDNDDGYGMSSSTTINTNNIANNNNNNTPSIIRYQGDTLWHHVLQLMGGDFAALSAAVKGEYRGDIMELRCNDGDGSGDGLRKRKDNGGEHHQNHGSGI